MAASLPSYAWRLPLAELKAPPQQLVFVEIKPLLAHTALAIAGTVILFVPALLLCGVLVQLLKVWHFFLNGHNSLFDFLDEVTMHGLQLWLATFTALAVPAHFLDRTNTTIVCSVVGTLLAILSVASIVGFFAPIGTGPTVMGGFTSGAEIIGAFAALIYFYSQHR